MDAHIVGWGHTPFGRMSESVEELVCQAAKEAISHANIDPKEIDGIWLGHYNGGLVPDGFISSLALQVSPDLRFTPATRLENACASGSAAVFAARNAIKAGTAKVTLVIGVEKMTAKDTKGVAESLMTASYQAEEGGITFPQVFGRYADAYFQAHGDKSEILARIAAKNHTNSVKNPLAQMQKDVGFDFCNLVSEKNPLVAPPLRLTDCSLISDGAAALIMVADDMSNDFDRAVSFKAGVQVNDFLPMSSRDILKFEGPAEAFRRAFSEAKIDVSDLDFAEVHDCFTIAELLIYEAMGLAKPGRGSDLVLDGTVHSDGALPINLSGGLKAKGHPVGATGVSMHALTAAQISGEAGTLQKEGASLGCIFNMGGSGVANYCSILENAGI
jgi:acetyl-CoA C-acetyltransferase|tara:strand:- start:310 stop:1470 length:1161 start_codon:yes stop_codon:yes gene_type:complete